MRKWLVASVGLVALFAAARAAETGKTTGKVCAVTEEVLEIAVEGQVARFFVPRRNKLAVLEVWQVNRGEEITVVWVLDGGKKWVRDIEGRGTLVGQVTAKGERWIEVKPEGGKPQRFRPRWVGGSPAAGGGFDKKMLAAIRETALGTRVKLTWEMPEGKRVVAIEPVR